jgi:hypothetical protein
MSTIHSSSTTEEEIDLAALTDAVQPTAGPDEEMLLAVCGATACAILTA